VAGDPRRQLGRDQLSRSRVTEPSREILPRPDGVRAFAGPAFAGIADSAPSGRVRLDALARWLQDIAYLDVLDAGLASVAVWVVRRTRIRVNRWPRFAEPFELTTFCSGLGRMWAERRTDIVPVGDGGVSGGSLESRSSRGPGGVHAPGSAALLEPIVQVSCLWVHIDPERLLPSPVQPVEIDMWTGPSTPPVKARLHHPAPVGDAVARAWTFRASELDVAEHVNNAAYFTPLDDELLSISSAPGAADVETVDLEIEYRGPSHAGPHNVLAAGPMRWIASEAGEVTASAMLADWPA
jgi:acyl-ACP thioesterase